jgi:methylmalonyl-CoA mutase cobalamin-binding subunit
VVEREFALRTPKEVTAVIKQRLRRPLVVVGACIGTDAHTVGIDAILNVKGWAGEKGLEAYGEVTVHNLGAQVSIPDLVAAAQSHGADAVLVSQVVTQRDAHVANVSEMSAAFREAYPAGRRPLLIVGGPRFDESWTDRLGVDRIFSRGTTPAEVASYLVHALLDEPGGARSLLPSGQGRDTSDKPSKPDKADRSRKPGKPQKPSKPSKRTGEVGDQQPTRARPASTKRPKDRRKVPS